MFMKANPESPFAGSRFSLLRLQLKRWWREKSGWVLEKLHSPAKIKEFEYVDPITNEAVYLSTGTRYSVLHVGDKQFFFDRVTGRFDGTGESLQLRVSERHELFD